MHGYQDLALEPRRNAGGKCVKKGKVEHRKLLHLYGKYRYVLRVTYILNKLVQVIAT